MRLLLILFLLASCSTKKSDQHYRPDDRIDTILLGYRFSMNEDDFQKHTQELLDSGTLKLSARRNIVFPFAGYEGSFSPTFSDAGMMKEFGMAVTGGHPKIMQVDLYGKTIEKYWNQDGWQESEGYLKGSITLTYQQGNLQIKILEGIQDARIFFKDMSADPDSVVPDASQSFF